MPREALSPNIRLLGLGFQMLVAGVKQRGKACPLSDMQMASRTSGGTILPNRSWRKLTGAPVLRSESIAPH